MVNPIIMLALIPARSGSIRIPNKNKRNFCGKSLIEITVTEALKAKKINHIGFSSDSPEYLATANKAGLSEKYLRPKKTKNLKLAFSHN